MAQVPVEQLRRVCDPSILQYTSSGQVQALETIIGQERAVKALRFGLGIKDRGFNIYVSGLPGTGRTTAIRRFLEEVARDKPVPDGWCYVNNFRDPYRPQVLRLPPVRARELQADLKRLVSGALREIRAAFESEEYADHKEELTQAIQRQREEVLSRVNDDAQREGFAIQVTPVGLLTIPIRHGQPLSDEEFMALKPEDKEALRQKRAKVQAEIESGVRQAKRLERAAYEQIQQLDRDVASYALSHPIEDLKAKYQDLPEVATHLDEMRDDILENLDQFRSQPAEAESGALPFQRIDGQEPLFRRYGANLLVDHAGATGAPVVTELNPTYNNLFGRIEQEAQFGALTTDFSLIRGGSLHQANGGYLVLPVADLLRDPFSWEGLKRALHNGEIVIEDAASQIGFITRSLKPQPVPLDVKVILIGRPDLYQLLRAYDEHFSELFKVKADFDSQMDRTDESIHDYAAFVCTVCENEDLKHLDSGAMARIVEYGSRLVEDQDKLSTRFGEISDVIREASYYASAEGAPLVSAAHIRKAIEERFYRSGLIRERIEEMIERGSILIDVTGEIVGQVNGLSVVSLGDVNFGQPNRITASIALGREGLVDIEREAKLGGPIHTKGVLILSGYLATKYAQNKPLSLSARLVFEQSYGGVDGDSASSTELYAILSSLSGLPIKQGIAVTGSVNQKGEVQAIGGVNEKIEGFFEICKAKGLTGEQGVLIPSANVPNLMLKEEIVEAVEQNQFHIWSVRTIDEGIEILTGFKAGERTADGVFEGGTVNGLVDKRLHDLAETMSKYLGGEGMSR
jgi:lon-related putative ATP-dependent protease